MLTLLVALCGGLGAGTRFVVDGFLARRRPWDLPAGTVVINVTGSFALGVLTAWAAHHGPGGSAVKSMVGTGFLGGYTTFSTACVDVVRVGAARRPMAAIALAATTAALAIAAAAIGFWIGGR